MQSETIPFGLLWFSLALQGPVHEINCVSVFGLADETS